VTAAHAAPTAATTSGQALPAALGALWSTPARRVTTVKCARTCSNRSLIRRSHPRTVDAGTPITAAILRCPAPAARATRAAPITAARGPAAAAPRVNAGSPGPGTS
jgi:hypothetical protein